MTNTLSEPAERSSNSKLDIVNCQNSPTFSEFNEMESCLPMQKNLIQRASKENFMTTFHARGK